MSRVFGLIGTIIGLGLVSMACSSSPTAATGTASVTAPTATAVASGQGNSPSAASTSAGTHGQRLIAIIGTGSGIVNVTPTAAVNGSFSAQIEVAVHGAPANTTFYVQRAPEIGRSNSADGVCQRAPNFVTFPLPGAGPLVTLQTSAGGAGTVHIDFTAPAIADGAQFDVMFRVVDSLIAPITELRTGCFTVSVK